MTHLLDAVRNARVVISHQDRSKVSLTGMTTAFIAATNARIASRAALSASRGLYGAWAVRR